MTRWASTNRNGKVETFTDVAGHPTTTRPHVHTIHEPDGRVVLIATDRDGAHAHRVELTHPSGNAVRDQQLRLGRLLNEHDRNQERGSR